MPIQVELVNTSAENNLWGVGDQAYVWYPRKKANARELKGSIIKISLIEQVSPNKWKACILLSGYTTMWAKADRIIYVTTAELFAELDLLLATLETRYHNYLMDQVNTLCNKRGASNDPS